MIAWMFIGGILLAGYLVVGRCALDTERIACKTAAESMDLTIWLNDNDWAQWAWPYVVICKPWRNG